MSHFPGRFKDFMSRVRDSLEWCLRRNLDPESIFLKCALSILKSETVSNDLSETLPKHGFDYYHSLLQDTISEHGFPSPEATSSLNELRSFYPSPHVEITAEGVWNHISVSVQTHMKSTFDDAVANIESTGRSLSPEDGKYLQLLLTHSSGWSATYPEQMNAHWATFFKDCYPHISDLVLILDNMTYPEELRDLPGGRTPEQAEFFLLATPESYYVYDCAETLAGTGSGLNRAGQTLKEVYLGMKEWRHMDVKDPWEREEDEWADCRRYFPHYRRNKDGIYLKYGS